uniref:GSKIP domain-containing protein n=1 Tax=Panagrolaimus davidi TaxID=227884 RepID=A0A914Q5D1_9BILA
MDFELDDEIPDECFIQISAQFYSHLQKMAQIVVEDYTVELTCVSDYGDDGAVIRIYGPEAHSCYVTLHQMQQSFERFGMESSDCSDSLNMTAANYENEYERFCKKQLTQLLRDFNDSILVRKPVQ